MRTKSSRLLRNSQHNAASNHDGARGERRSESGGVQRDGERERTVNTVTEHTTDRSDHCDETVIRVAWRSTTGLTSDVSGETTADVAVTESEY